MSSWFGNDSNQAQAYQQFQSSGNDDHQASWSHELIAGAASFEAAKAYENHVSKNGPPASHAEAKELLAGFAGAFVDREFETRGLDTIDREKAKYEARKQLHNAYDTNNGQI